MKDIAMRLLNNLNLSLPRLHGSAAPEPTKPADKHGSTPATTLPPEMNANAGARAAAYAKNKGSAMARKLRTMFKTSKTEKLPPSVPLNPAVALREALTNNHEKFKRTHSDINKAMARWQSGEETLQFLLTPYVLAGRKQPGVPQRDGLRSGVTGFLNGMLKTNAGASEQLRNAARDLSKAPIFKTRSPDGTEQEYTLLNFATPGEQGISKIDGLNLSQEQKAQIAQRLNLALIELNNLGNAYVSNGPVPAPLMDRANCIVLAPLGADPDTPNARRAPMGPRPMPRTPRQSRRPSARSQAAAQASAPAAASTMILERLAALAGTHLSDEELQSIFDGSRTLASWTDVINQRASQHAQSREAGTAASRSSGDPDLIDKANEYLSREELDRIEKEADVSIFDYLHIIEERIELGAKGGNYDVPPAYGDHAQDVVINPG